MAGCSENFSGGFGLLGLDDEPLAADGIAVAEKWVLAELLGGGSHLKCFLICFYFYGRAIALGGQ